MSERRIQRRRGLSLLRASAAEKIQEENVAHVGLKSPQEQGASKMHSEPPPDESAEITVLTLNHDWLTDVLPPEDIALLMVTKGLLTRREHDTYAGMRNGHLPDFAKNEYLLRCLKKREPGFLKTFCDILREISAAKHIADTLEKEYSSTAVDTEAADPDHIWKHSYHDRERRKADYWKRKYAVSHQRNRVLCRKLEEQKAQNEYLQEKLQAISQQQLKPLMEENSELRSLVSTIRANIDSKSKILSQASPTIKQVDFQQDLLQNLPQFQHPNRLNHMASSGSWEKLQDSSTESLELSSESRESTLSLPRPKKHSPGKKPLAYSIPPESSCPVADNGTSLPCSPRGLHETLHAAADDVSMHSCHQQEALGCSAQVESTANDQNIPAKSLNSQTVVGVRQHLRQPFSLLKTAELETLNVINNSPPNMSTLNPTHTSSKPLNGEQHFDDVGVPPVEKVTANGNPCQVHPVQSLSVCTNRKPSWRHCCDIDQTTPRTLKHVDGKQCHQCSQSECGLTCKSKGLCAQPFRKPDPKFDQLMEKRRASTKAGIVSDAIRRLERELGTKS